MPLNPGALRSMVAGWLTDTCTIATRGTEPDFDDTTGTYSVDAGDELYDGPCRVMPLGSKTAAAGETLVPLRAYDVKVPWDTTGIDIDHVITVTASNDPYLVDRQLRVVDVQGGTDAAYRKLICEDLLAVAEYDEEGS